MLSIYACCLDILNNFMNLACPHNIFRRWFQVKTICNGSLSKLLWVFLNYQWFFNIRNTLKGFLSKPLGLLIYKNFWQINWKPYTEITWIKKFTRPCFFIQKVSRSKVYFILRKGVLHYIACHHFVHLRFPCRSRLLITSTNQ